MITAFHLYAINAAISLYGTILFLWWWKKTGRATEIYILVTILFGAEFIEKTIFTWVRYQAQYSGVIGMETHRAIVTHPFWWTVAIPTTMAFFLIVMVMTGRILRSNRAMKRTASSVRLPSPASRSVLVISNIKSTKDFMRNIFASARVEYNYAQTVIDGLETLVLDEAISIILIGLKAIEDANMRQATVVEMIKKERPWCVVVAMSAQPNLYELAEARRSFFDDYLYLPIKPNIVLMLFERWLAKVNRWKRLDYHDRRKRSGFIRDRRGIRVRRSPDNRSVKVECPMDKNGG